MSIEYISWCITGYKRVIRLSHHFMSSLYGNVQDLELLSLFSKFIVVSWWWSGPILDVYFFCERTDLIFQWLLLSSGYLSYKVESNPFYLFCYTIAVGIILVFRSNPKNCATYLFAICYDSNYWFIFLLKIMWRSFIKFWQKFNFQSHILEEKLLYTSWVPYQ